MTLDLDLIAQFNEAGERARKAYRAHVAAERHATTFACVCVMCGQDRCDLCDGRANRTRHGRVLCTCDLGNHGGND